MEKSLFEQLGGTYYKESDYLISDLDFANEEEIPIGIWGQRHLDYLKQCRRITYTNLITSGRLNSYLADINAQAQERFERLVEQMKQAQCIHVHVENWRQGMKTLSLFFLDSYN